MTPNQPKTPIRAVRVDGQLWDAAKAKADEDGLTLSVVLRAAMRQYVDGTWSPRD